MLSFEESKSLRSLLSADDRPFDLILTDFSSTFPRESIFRVACALAIILQEKKLLKPSQRLIALSMIRHAYSSLQQSANPFISILIDAASDDMAEKSEAAFVQQLLAFAGEGNNKEVLKLSAAEYLKCVDPSAHVLLPKEKLYEQYYDRSKPEPYTSAFRKASINNVLEDPDVSCDCSSDRKLPPGSKANIRAGDTESTIIGLLQNLSLEGLGLQWIRPPPPRLPVLDGELIWLNLDNNHELLWDHGMCVDPSRGAVVRDSKAKTVKRDSKAKTVKGRNRSNNDKLLLDHDGIGTNTSRGAVVRNSKGKTVKGRNRSNNDELHLDHGIGTNASPGAVVRDSKGKAVKGCNPDNNHELLLDHSTGTDTSRGVVIRDSKDKAIKGRNPDNNHELLLDHSTGVDTSRGVVTRDSKDKAIKGRNPDNNHELLLDHSMGADTSRGAVVTHSKAKAVKGHNPDNNRELHRDRGIGANASRGAADRDLLAKAVKGRLAPAQQEQLLAELAKDPNLLNHSGFTPKKLQELVQHNPSVAIEVLTILINSPDIGEYLRVLVDMKVSTNSMEFVSRLTTTAGLPPEFFHKYITDCISLCENTKKNSKQNKWVKVISVFFQRLIKNKIITAKDNFVEVQAFSIEFHRIEEAAELFSLLKTLQ